VEPAAEDAPITRFLTERSGGLHHLAWRVDDIDEAHRRCIEAGLEVLGDGPGPGAHGARVFFLHPRSTRHVLHELVEDAAAGAERGARS
jgi:methylmalonyl-CoA/ethylmalonyl-CoA epimerase